jgi:catechol 2,3-dioxygenase-like lactoylglutathione lyase family enzyme
MIGYVMVGTNDLEKSKSFYDAVLGELGGKRTMAGERMQGWGNGKSPVMFMVCKPYDEKPASVGNGTMISLAAASKDVVGKVHAKAMSLGAKDEGAPGPRGDSGFYAGYFRDGDGNKLCVFTMG